MKIRNGEESFMTLWKIGNYHEKRNQIRSEIEAAIEKQQQVTRETNTESEKEVLEINDGELSKIKDDYSEYTKNILLKTSLKYKYQT